LATIHPNLRSIEYEDRLDFPKGTGEWVLVFLDENRPEKTYRMAKSEFISDGKTYQLFEKLEEMK
jgi:hypothetical protein